MRAATACVVDWAKRSRGFAIPATCGAIRPGSTTSETDMTAPAHVLQHASVVGGVLGAVRAVLGDAAGRIALHEPEFRGREWEYVKECLETGWISSVGSADNTDLP